MEKMCIRDRVRTVRSDGKLVFNTDYEYANGKAENSTTNLVSKMCIRDRT